VIQHFLASDLFRGVRRGDREGGLELQSMEVTDSADFSREPGSYLSKRVALEGRFKGTWSEKRICR